MQKSLAERIEHLVEEGETALNSSERRIWSKRAAAFVRAAFDPPDANAFESLSSQDEQAEHAMRMGHLEGVLARRAAGATIAQSTAASTATQPLVLGSVAAPNSQNVFVVHGHDNEAKESAARFLERLGLQPIVLHEQPSSGRTIIEKFETYSGNIAFAVVLLTADDLGQPAVGSAQPRPRARQNVILELGYFMGRLGRARVCALHRGGIEFPSDYQGVVYIEMDASGAWKAKLAQELVQAKLPIDLAGLLGG